MSLNHLALSRDARWKSYRFSRRSLLSTVAMGFGLSSLPVSLQLALGKGIPASAMAFDGDILAVTNDRLLHSVGDRGWIKLFAPTAGEIAVLATHPDRPGRIMAGLASAGIALSENGGRDWSVRSQGLPKGPVTAVTVALQNPDTFYVAVRGDGLWKSEDAGRSWVFVMDRPWLEGAERDITALASIDLATGMGGIWIYAGTELGLTRVPDCFCRWQEIQPGDAMEALASGTPPPPEAPLPVGEPINSFVSVASSPTRIYAALPSGIWLSDDAGVVWMRRSNLIAEVIATHPSDGDHVVAITKDGLIRSNDGGITWSALKHY